MRGQKQDRLQIAADHCPDWYIRFRYFSDSYEGSIPWVAMDVKSYRIISV